MKRVLSVFIILLLCFSSHAIAAGLSTPAVGDCVTFGRYEQDNRMENGKEPLEWIVLDVQDNHAFEQVLHRHCDFLS